MKMSPVIIIGMHRSGTTMITKLLEQVGFFSGIKNSNNWEARYFEEINEWMFLQAGASWDNPYNFNFINGYFKKNTCDVLGRYLKGPKRINFLGADKFFKYGDVRDLDIPWGWKDPKNTFTIDVWKEIFPQAKILHVYRNPIDVAESLRFREAQITASYKTPFSKTLKDYLGLRKRIFANMSFRIQNLHEGILLWEQYVTKALSLSAEFGDRMMHVKYEDFLDSPGDVMLEILSFIGLQVEGATVAKAAKMVKPERKYAFLEKPELLQFFREMKLTENMEKLNYSYSDLIETRL